MTIKGSLVKKRLQVYTEGAMREYGTEVVERRSYSAWIMIWKKYSA